MRLTDVLRSKGNSVVTVPPDADVTTLLGLLAEHRIGAVVVSSDGKAVDGIVSERDIVRALAAQGPDVLGQSVQSICTTDVHTVPPDAQVDDLTRLMTERRIRHVPVVQDGELRGIVSIGDVVKRRMDELEADWTALSNYINAG